MSVNLSSRSGSLTPLPSRSGGDPTRLGEETSPGSDVYPTPATEDLAPGTNVGRYLILGRLGAGAMGVVFTAWDPELDRKIALKLLHSRADNSRDNRARLLREAKSLARLSHPNVVGVHDVGTFGDRVFLAMEFVAGRTLTTWLKEQPRRWPEIAEVLRRAGEGLAAAHDAGLVHRDFKPDNVLIADDGRVRVLDFGLARSASEAPDSHTPDPEELAVLASVSSSSNANRLAEEALHTRTGALVGTPAYMSPEQHLGRAADARSDQFAFCVALYQALYRVRPFTASRMSALQLQIIQGKVEAAPAGAKVPTWLRRVVLRGLSTDPGARYPTMRALLAELDRDRRFARRGGGFVAGLGGLAIAVALWQRPALEEPCAGSRDRLTDVWDAPRIAEVERAFTQTDLPYAADAFAGVRRGLDDYAERWVTIHHDTCAATVIRHELSEGARDLRMRCLERNRTALATLTGALRTANASAIEHAPEAIAQLGDLAGCVDDDALDAIVKPPEDPARVIEIETQIAEAAALELAGDFEAASDRANEAVGAAQGLGYDPAIAEALRTRARIQQRLHRNEVAAGSLLDAIFAAARGHDDRTAALAWIDLVFLIGANAPDETRLDAYLRSAEERLLRAGNDALLRANLDFAHAAGLQRLGHDEEALQVLLRALPPLDSDVQTHPLRLSQALNLLGLIHHRSGRLADARAAFERSVVVLDKVSGRAHPGVASVLMNLAELEIEAGNLEDAERLASEADAIRRAALPEGHIDRIDSAMTRAHIAEARGDAAGTEAQYIEVLNNYKRKSDLDKLYLGVLYNDMGVLAAEQDQLDKARGYYESALAAFRERYGPEHQSAYVWTARSNLAELALWRDEPDEAVPLLLEILPHVERELPGAETARIHTLLAQARLARKEIPAAVEQAERAVKIIDALADISPQDSQAAISRATLAVCLAAAHRDEERVRVLRYLATEPLEQAPRENAARRALAALRRLQTP